MISLGLIGYPLSHSLSPKLHAAALQSCGLKGEYHLYPVSPEDRYRLEELTHQLRSGDPQGLNVTIPHKQSVMEFLDDLSPSAKTIGAVNTLVYKNRQLIGENTDAPGFLMDLHRSVPKGFRTKKTIVLGAGGAARAVVYGLLNEGWDVTLSVRKSDLGQASQLIDSLGPVSDGRSIVPVLLDATELKPHMNDVTLVVNTTPLGMFPEIENCPWPKALQFPRGAVIYDLVYNPRETALMRQARSEDLLAVSGIGMLVEQAALSFEIWTGLKPSLEEMFSVVEVV